MNNLPALPPRELSFERLQKIHQWRVWTQLDAPQDITWSFFSPQIKSDSAGQSERYSFRWLEHLETWAFDWDGQPDPLSLEAMPEGGIKLQLEQSKRVFYLLPRDSMSQLDRNRLMQWADGLQACRFGQLDQREKRALPRFLFGSCFGNLLIFFTLPMLLKSSDAYFVGFMLMFFGHFLIGGFFFHESLVKWRFRLLSDEQRKALVPTFSKWLEFATASFFLGLVVFVALLFYLSR